MTLIPVYIFGFLCAVEFVTWELYFLFTYISIFTYLCVDIVYFVHITLLSQTVVYSRFVCACTCILQSCIHYSYVDYSSVLKYQSLWIIVWKLVLDCLHHIFQLCLPTFVLQKGELFVLDIVYDYLGDKTFNITTCWQIEDASTAERRAFCDI